MTLVRCSEEAELQRIEMQCVAAVSAAHKNRIVVQQLCVECGLYCVRLLYIDCMLMQVGSKSRNTWMK